jgi:hydroxymethylbilane synthase
MAALNVEEVPLPEPVPPDTRLLAKTFNVGTRKSALALAQTELVVQALKKAWPDYEFQIHARDTAAGDIDKVTPFKDMPVKNLWTHELEQLLIEKKLDLLVHSLKGRPSAELLA